MYSSEVRVQKVVTQRKSYDLIIGRNPVLEALKNKVPAFSLRIANGIDIDERVQEAIKFANDNDISIVQVDRRDLDRITDHGPHQGLCLLCCPEYRSIDKNLVE